ncbi:MAG TPA: hypothetical protein VGD07_19640 [Methylomirabilota bacterium]|jgi:hypothetical protein
MLSLEILGVKVRIRCAEAETRALVTAHYRPMQRPVDTADLTYTVARPRRTWLLARDGVAPVAASDPGELLLLLDQDLIIQLQTLRADLYFVHAAVLESGGEAFMLVAASGGGKSTTAWGLVHHGFGYLSDELAPVDLGTMTVHPYPRALALKTLPPRSYPLPPTTLSSSRGFHVSTAGVPSGIGATAAPLAAVLFLRYAPGAGGPSVARISAAEAGARLYVNALNALAHPAEGLDAAIHIAGRTACFELSTAEVTATCALVRVTLDGLAGSRRHGRAGARSARS